MSTLLRNPYDVPLSLPFPLKGVVPPGGAVIVSYSQVQLESLCAGIGRSFVMRDMTNTVDTVGYQIPPANVTQFERSAAIRTAGGISDSLSIADRIVQLDRTGNFTEYLPSVAEAAGLDFLLQIRDVQTVTLTLAPSDIGARVYFQNNTPLPGASVTLSGADGGLRPAFLIVSDGVDWWVS